MKLTKQKMIYLLMAVLIGLIICKCLFPVMEGQTNDDDDNASDPAPGQQQTTNIPLPIDSDNGVCYGEITASGNHACGLELTEDNCNINTSVCLWKKGDDIHSISGGLEGVTFIEWMRTLGLVDVNGHIVSNSSIPTEALTTSSVNKPILDIVFRNNDKYTDTQIKDNNFLYYLKKNSNDTEGITTANDVTNNPYIPKNLRGIVKEYVQQCESGWDSSNESKRMYELHGNRPIMTYSLVDGLVCRNPFYKPVYSIGTEQRIYTNTNDGPGHGCPSPNNPDGDSRKYVSESGNSCDRFRSECNWTQKGFVDGTTGFVVNNLPGVESGACGLPACRSMYPGFCAKDTVGQSVNDFFSWFHNKSVDLYR